ncbi:hypothetical protein D621_01385 [beta proteobacterium AAP51]|nr:hypothetical protein D621_01385 [beta proteobacterium AAP51]
MLGRWPALRELVETALRRQPAQEDMRLWQLLLHAQAGDLPALRQSLQRLHEWTPDIWMRLPIKALQAFLALAETRCAQGTVAALRAQAPHGGPPQAWAVWRTLQRIAFLRHTPWPRLHQWLSALISAPAGRL